MEPPPPPDTTSRSWTPTRKAIVVLTAAAHARFASEPCHPALACLHGTVRALRAWAWCGAGGASSSGHGLALLDAVLTALGDMLDTPQAAAALHDADADDDQVLDGLLVLADAYRTFEAALLAAKQSVTDMQVGAQRGDGTVVVASLRTHRRTEKELHYLIAVMWHTSTSRRVAVVPSSADAVDTEVVAAVAEASAVVFSRYVAFVAEHVGHATNGVFGFAQAWSVADEP
ncbi:uncharacterized protein [Miscanthus floridulus]|uniref:uncharacterized protein n=1 Tax=Miscanthus floridulus TaxID=154761 RepID=UPI003458CDFC